MELTTIIYFLGASIALTLAPGPDNIFVMTLGITRGRKSAIVTALGMCSGVSIHTAAAAFGISAILYSSLLAFNIVKYAGAAYLLYLAFRTLKEGSSIGLGKSDSRPVGELFKRGFVMNVLNPKVGMFFLAFLPQFISPSGSNVPLQMMFLGAIFMVQAIVIFSLIGYFSGSLGRAVLAKPRIARYFDWLTAGVFASLGVRLALAQR
ncbi:LysE family translocator [Geobacter sp. DSM 9736]|uniref:LysE family translocator n=1 Tax=Geobacter sp. DSM 9736 TaxID=1277350 RepID=UPI000B510633|nr:LysE family translocator [Geobacter sp. DSM 9736]SNB44707.1 Threonine/homoserine/homoserine lactone efflux protein [Geobacter sp. DSM 9736]